MIWYFYQGGIREVPYRSEMAANILDGDPSTYWEPSTEVSEEEYHALPPGEQGPIYYFAKDAAGQERRVDRDTYEQTSTSGRRIQYNSRSLEKWYVDVELGRVVPASKIVLRFVDEEVGEPFRQFRILTTPSQKRDATLSLTARTVTPNEDRRVVEFDNLIANDPSRNYLLVHRLRIQIMESKFDKFKEISEREYYGPASKGPGGHRLLHCECSWQRDQGGQGGLRSGSRRSPEPTGLLSAGTPPPSGYRGVGPGEQYRPRHYRGRRQCRPARAIDGGSGI